MIKGSGSQSSIMIIEDFPTKDEVSKGIAGFGSCGRLLNKILLKNGSSLQECFITLFIKEYIPLEGVYRKLGYKNTERHFQNYFKEKYTSFSNLLLEEIKLINPNVIICAGELALNFLSNERNIEHFRGSVLQPSPQLNLQRKIKIIPIFHPRKIIEDPKRLPATIRDVSRAVEYKNIIDPIEPDYLLWICKNANELDAYFSRNINPEFVTCDIETYLGFITCIGFCCDGKEAISIPLLCKDVNILDEYLMWNQIARFLNSGVPIVNQNIKFDKRFQNKFGFQLKNIYADTMLAGHTIYPELPRGLDFFTSIYTNIPYYKDEGKEFNPKIHDFSRLYLYNALDCLSTWRVWKAQEKELEELNLKHFFFSGPMKWFHVYEKMENNGVSIDETRRKEIEFKYWEDYCFTLECIKKVAGVEINVNAPKQISNLLYNEMQIPEQKHFKTGEITTEEDAIEFLILNVVQNPDVKRILNMILYARKTYKIVQWLKFIKHPDGHLHTSYNLCGTESGRTTTPKKKGSLEYFYYCNNGKIEKEKYGIPFQTIPKRGFRLPDGTLFGRELISIFVPSNGYVFVEGDLSQAEARIVALLAEDWELLEDFDKSSGYVHKKTAGWIFDRAISSIIKGSFEYDIGKKGRHAAHYNQTKFGLSKTAQISLNLSDVVLNKIHSNNPNIHGVFQRRVRDKISKDACLSSPLGRRRDFFGTGGSEEVMREAFAQVPQSTTSDHTKSAMVRIEERFPKVRFLIENHDGIFAEVPEDMRYEYAAILKCEMEQTINFREGSFYIPYDLKIPVERSWSNTNWEEMKGFEE